MMHAAELIFFFFFFASHDFLRINSFHRLFLLFVSVVVFYSNNKTIPHSWGMGQGRQQQ